MMHLQAKEQAPENLTNTVNVRPVVHRARLDPGQVENGPLNTGESQTVSFLDQNRPLFQGPTVAEMRRLVAQEAAQQLCLWGEVGTTAIFWDRLHRVLRTAPYRRAIYKVERVQQPEGRIRFDIFVSTAVSEQILQLIRSGSRAHSYGWYIRPHVPYVERVGRQASIGAVECRQQAHAPLPVPIDVPTTGGEMPDSRPTKLLRVATYNINGVAHKRTELRVFLEQERCDVLGLQETLLRATDWHLRFPQYRCFTSAGARRASTRGLALVISDRFASNPVGTPSPNWIFARIFGADLVQPVLVGTVYVPHRAGRNAVLARLPQEIARLKHEFPDDPVILTGDWNMGLEEVQREVVTWPFPVHPLANRGLAPTRRRGTRAIDHIAYWGNLAAGGPVPAPRVRETWDLSDHYPVVARFPQLTTNNPPAAPEPPREGTLPRIWVKDPEIRGQIAHANYWSALADEIHEATDDPTGAPADIMNHVSQRWTETCHTVARELSLIRTGPLRPTTVSKSITRAVKRRRRTYKRLTQAMRHGSDADVDLATTTYKKAKQSCELAIKRLNMKRWHKQIRKAHAQMLHRPRAFWQFSARHGRWQTKGAPAGLQPVYSTDGSLLTNLPDIVQRWAEHYETLGTDITGHSQDEEYWQPIFDPQPSPDPLTDLDADFDRQTIWAALSKMKRHKAPGKDGIPTDFIQGCLLEQKWAEAALNQPATVEPVPTPMTDCLVDLTNYAFQNGIIPSNWEESVVLSLPKDGDLADCGNYRGISLMSTTLKVITVILADRISVAGEQEGLFSPTQAGFRRLEECITQAACVIDILQRRRIVGLTTYATFVDLKKAYDTVPHGALFAKLSRFGVQGRCLAFLKGLYRSSHITVRVGHGETAQFSDPFPLRRGLRQGCPLSPVLFNIFINDLLEDQAELTGVAVPTGSQARGFHSTITVAGALFADDAVGLTPSVDTARQFCDRITDWCEVNEMEVGIRKCGIMEFLPNPEAPPFLTEDHPLRLTLQIGEQDVPLVTEYKYLGLGVTPKLQIVDLVRSRLQLGRTSVLHLLPFFRSSILPLSMRWTVARAVILPRLLYGAEIYGMNRALTNQMQTLWNQTLKTMLGISRGNSASVPSAPLWASFGIPPICALSAGLRARAYAKCFLLSTQIGRLIRDPLRTRSWTWSTGIVRWINRFCKKYFAFATCWPAGTLNPETWVQLDPGMLRLVVQQSITHRERQVRTDPNRSTGPATITFFRGGYLDPERSLTRGRIFCRPPEHRGIGLVIRCRIGCYLTAPALVVMQRLPDQYRNTCPCCREQEPESLYHLLFQCHAFRRQRRTSGLMGTIAEVRQLQHRKNAATSDADLAFFDSSGISTQSDEALALAWILGGIYAKDWGVPNFLPQAPRPEQADEDYSSSSSSTSSSASSTSNRGPAAQCRPLVPEPVHLLKVGKFLVLIEPLRRRIINPLLLPAAGTINRRRQDPWVPATSTGQSLNG